MAGRGQSIFLYPCITHICMHACVCGHLCVVVHVRLCAYKCWGPRLIIGGSSWIALPLYSLRQDLSLKPRTYSSSQFALGIAYFSSQKLLLQEGQKAQSLFIYVLVNPIPVLMLTSTLTIEPSPQTPESDFFWDMALVQLICFCQWPYTHTYVGSTSQTWEFGEDCGKRDVGKYEG